MNFLRFKGDDARYRVVKSFTVAGYDCLVLSDGEGYRLGVVCLPFWHPWYGIKAASSAVTTPTGRAFAAYDTHGRWWIGFSTEDTGFSSRVYAVDLDLVREDFHTTGNVVQWRSANERSLKQKQYFGIRLSPPVSAVVTVEGTSFLAVQVAEQLPSDPDELFQYRQYWKLASRVKQKQRFYGPLTAASLCACAIYIFEAYSATIRRPHSIPLEILCGVIAYGSFLAFWIISAMNRSDLKKMQLAINYPRQDASQTKSVSLHGK